MMVHLLLSLASILCLFENATAFLPSSPTITDAKYSSSTVNSNTNRFMATKNSESEIKSSGNEMVKTEDLQWSNNNNNNNNKPLKSPKVDKRVDPSSELNMDKYHFTTKSNKELIFDERTGRFFETSIRPGSLHQLWQEYLHETDDNNDNDKSADQALKMNDFSSNDMIPTDILFGNGSLSSSSLSSSKEALELLLDEEEECLVHTPYQDSCEPTPWNVLNDDEEQSSTTKSKKKKPKKEPNTSGDDDISDSWSPPTTVVEECYKAWNQRDMGAAAKCFVNNGEYRDYQYLGQIANRQQLEEHFTQQANLLPPNSRIVLDHLAYNVEKGKIATQWHVERPDGTAVKFTKGCSFYTLDKESGLIQSGYRTSEMVVKPNRGSINALLSLAPTMGSTTPTRTTFMEKNLRQSSCIVQQFFDAWNHRDMEAALECLDDNCVYQTEDPVFVGTLNGKESMREHLIQNANVLPAAAKIVLDDLAVDTHAAGTTIGTRWHLEVNGVALPNLHGCSMYTTDPDTGKIKTALDITEAPVKLPRRALSFMRAPAAAIFDWN